MIYRDPHHSHQQSASKCKKSASKIPSPHTNHPLINITFIHPSERSASNYERNRRNARVRVGEVFVNSLFTFLVRRRFACNFAPINQHSLYPASFVRGIYIYPTIGPPLRALPSPMHRKPFKTIHLPPPKPWLRETTLPEPASAPLHHTKIASLDFICNKNVAILKEIQQISIFLGVKCCTIRNNRYICSQQLLQKVHLKAFLLTKCTTNKTHWRVCKKYRRVI